MLFGVMQGCVGSTKTGSPADRSSAAPQASEKDDAVRNSAAPPSPALNSPSTSSSRARGWKIVVHALEGMGGAAAVDAVRSMELRGRSLRTGLDGRPVEVKTTTRILFPDRYRQDIETPTGALSVVIGPGGAFLVAPGDEGAPRGTPLPPEQRREVEISVMRNPLALLKTRRDQTFEAIFGGEEEVGGRPVELVQVLSGGVSTLLSVERETGRVVRLRFDALEVLYSDFRPSGRLVYPFAAEGRSEGKTTMTTSLETILVNGAMPPSLFEPPGM